MRKLVVILLIGIVTRILFSVYKPKLSVLGYSILLHNPQLFKKLSPNRDPTTNDFLLWNREVGLNALLSEFVPKNVESQNFVIQEKNIVTRDGSVLKAMLYTPKGDGPFPILVHFPAGWVSLTPQPLNTTAHNLILTLLDDHVLYHPWIYLDVAYRVPPEFPFPVPPRDCYDSLIWVYNNADQIHVDIEKIVIFGESMGGNMASVVSGMIRDEGGVPKIAHQLLVVPFLDWDPGDPETIPYHNGYGLTVPILKWYFGIYNSEKFSDDGCHPYLCPLRMKSMAGLPNTTVVVAEYDPLRSGAEKYVERLRQEGVEAELLFWKHSIHYTWVSELFGEYKKILLTVLEKVEGKEEVCPIINKKMMFKTKGIM